MFARATQIYFLSSGKCILPKYIYASSQWPRESTSPSFTPPFRLILIPLPCFASEIYSCAAAKTARTRTTNHARNTSVLNLTSFSPADLFPNTFRVVTVSYPLPHGPCAAALIVFDRTRRYICAAAIFLITEPKACMGPPVLLAYLIHIYTPMDLSSCHTELKLQYTDIVAAGMQKGNTVDHTSNTSHVAAMQQ